MKITNTIVEEKAKHLGFDLVGFAEASILTDEIEQYQKWLSNGYHSEMSYMERNIDRRRNVKEILPTAKSVISLGVNYFAEGKHSNNSASGKVSRFAWGKDYHLVLWEKLDKLISELEMIDNTFKAKSYVDTGPVMDKVWAVRSGLGWQGKHSNVINPKIGSWFFIATIITNYSFSTSEIITDHCGKCTACMDACPTDAIVDSSVVDANRCISNLTIENRGDIPEEFKSKFDNWIFGCDICQEVCPWNQKFSTPTNISEFADVENKEIELQSVSELTNSKFKKKYLFSPILRARAKGLKRNAKFLSK